MRHRRRLLSLIAGVVLVGALPTIAAANTTEAVAETGGMTLTMPGVPGITVGVTLDEFGNIIQVSVDGTDVIQNSAPVHKVTFDLGTDGSTTVQVKAKGEKLSTKVKTSNLESLVGAQTWTGDIFGAGFPATVNYTIAQVDGAMPYLEITSVTVDSAVENSLSGPYTKQDGDDDDNEQEYESQAMVTFTKDGYTKTLKIEVDTKYDDDHGYNGVYGKLKIELKGKDRQVLAGADVYGPQSWTGLLCDGTTTTVNYTVAQDGTLTVDDVAVADGATYSVDYDENGFKVEFTDAAGNDGAKLKVELENEDGTLELKVDSKTTTSCDGGDDDEYKNGDDDEDHSYTSGDDEDDDDSYKSGDDENDDEDHSSKSGDDEDDDENDD